MGQLERYGIYVLSLIIFLILGIAIWGDDPGKVEPTGGVDGPRVLNTTSGTGPGEVSDEQLRKLQEEANLNDVLKFMNERSRGTDAGPRGELPLKRVNDKTNRNGTMPRRVPTRPPQPRTYTVVEGDTLERIARKHLGKGYLWPKIAAANKNIRPDRLKPGMVLKIPLPPPRKNARASIPGVLPNTWTVKRGDTLGSISLALFKSTRYAKEIMRVNAIDDPTRLQVGQILKVPGIDISKAQPRR